MYSVQRRRTGCKTCRERKVKCDEARPTCVRCEKAKFVCKGYDDGLETVQRRSAPPRSGGPERHTQKLVKRAKSQPVETDTESTTLPMPNFLELDLSAFQDTMCLRFTLQSFFNQRNVSYIGKPYGKGASPNWLSHAFLLCLQDPASQPAARSLCTAYFSKIHHDAITEREGIVQYNTALREVQQRLNDPVQVHSLEALRDTMILGLYEMVMMTSVSGWMDHAAGMTKLFLHQGPYAFQNEFARHILESSRHMIILECLMLNKHCFLSEYEWQTVPWALSETPKTLGMQLLDILSFIPGLFEDYYTLRMGSPSSEEEKSAYSKGIQEKIDIYLDELFTWRLKWEVDHPVAAYTATSNSIELMNVESPFPTVIHFDHLDSASVIMLYDASLLTILEQGLAHKTPELERKFNPKEIAPSLNPLLLPSTSLTTKEIVVEICRMVEYNFVQAYRTMGITNLVWPASLAWMVSEHDLDMQNHLERILDVIAGEFGFEVSRTLLQYEEYSPGLEYVIKL